MEYLNHRRSSHNFDVKKRECVVNFPPQKRMRLPQFDSGNSSITPMNQVSMSLSSSNDGYTPYSVPVQQYRAAARPPVRSYPVPCMPSQVPDGALPAVPCMPSHIPNGALPVNIPNGALLVPCKLSHIPNGATSHSDLIGSLLSRGVISLPNQPQPPSQSPKEDTSHSDLIGSLLSKGLIFLPNQPQPPSQSPKEETSAQDSIGLEFDHARLNIRRESVITALYADLPRQCGTCGRRFKSQEEHALHMDWHVKKNRSAIAAKRKRPQPVLHSQKFFLSKDLWLKAAEAIGTVAGPAFFVNDNVEDKKKPEEAVLADEDQKACPLCMEPFEEYFSNETNDWMYRGTAYFKPKRNLHRSLEGRIVHANCMN